MDYLKMTPEQLQQYFTHMQQSFQQLFALPNMAAMPTSPPTWPFSMPFSIPPMQQNTLNNSTGQQQDWIQLTLGMQQLQTEWMAFFQQQYMQYTLQYASPNTPMNSYYNGTSAPATPEAIKTWLKECDSAFTAWYQEPTRFKRIQELQQLYLKKYIESTAN